MLAARALTQLHKSQNEENDDFFVLESREMEPSEPLDLEAKHEEKHENVHCRDQNEEQNPTSHSW